MKVKQQVRPSLRARILASACAIVAAVCMTTPASANENADFNLDGIIDSADLAVLLSAWGQAGDHRADLDANGVVGQVDLAMLLSVFGLVSDLEFGPIAGLTTVWHEAPAQTGIPVGTVVDLRIHVPTNATVLWFGAEQILRDDEYSVARCILTDTGLQTASVDVMSGGAADSRAIQFDVIDIAIDDIVMSDIEVLYEPLEIDETLPEEELNALTMQYFFSTNSIAAITEVRTDSYLTSIGGMCLRR